jgi:transposase
LADDQLQLSVTGACRRVGEQLGINRDTLRGWVKQAQIDAGARPGVSSGADLPTVEHQAGRATSS